MDIVGIKRFLNKDKDKTLDELIKNGIDNAVGTPDSPAGTGTIFGLLKRGMVKSVQRGVRKFNASNNATISISAINPSKAVVILNSSTEAGASNFFASNSYQAKGVQNESSYLVSLGATSLTISPCSLVTNNGSNASDWDRNYGSTSWQVIEYY